MAKKERQAKKTFTKRTASTYSITLKAFVFLVIFVALFYFLQFSVSGFNIPWLKSPFFVSSSNDNDSSWRKLFNQDSPKPTENTKQKSDNETKITVTPTGEATPTWPYSATYSLKPATKDTPEPIVKSTPTPTQTVKPTPTVTPTVKLTPTPTVEPTPSPTPTLEPTPSPTPTMEPTPSPTPTMEPTPSPTPTMEPTPSPTPTMEPTPSPTPTMEPTPSPTPTMEPTPSPTPTMEPTPSPTPTTEPTPSPTPTMEPTPSPTPTKKSTPRPTATVKPSPSPTLVPAPSPTPTPYTFNTIKPKPSQNPIENYYYVTQIEFTPDFIDSIISTPSKVLEKDDVKYTLPTLDTTLYIESDTYLVEIDMSLATVEYMKGLNINFINIQNFKTLSIESLYSCAKSYGVQKISTSWKKDGNFSTYQFGVTMHQDFISILLNGLCNYAYDLTN